MNGKLMEAVRAVVRPIITVSGWAVVVLMVYQESTVPEWFWTTVVGLTSWWFASRQSEEKKP